MSGFSIGGAVNGGAEWLCNAPIIRGVVGNPLFTALLITALVAAVVMGIYHRQIKAGGAAKAARAGIYVFFLVAAVMFVHHYAVGRSARDAASQKGIRDVFTRVEMSRRSGTGDVAVGGGPAVRPRLGGDAETDPDCGCPLLAGRPDNLYLGDDILEDVVLPTTTGLRR